MEFWAQDFFQFTRSHYDRLKHHGTTTLFAALSLLDGKVIGD